MDLMKVNHLNGNGQSGRFDLSKENIAITAGPPIDLRANLVFVRNHFTVEEIINSGFGFVLSVVGIITLTLGGKGVFLAN